MVRTMDLSKDQVRGLICNLFDEMSREVNGVIALLDDDGSLLGFGAKIVDIADRKAAEAAIARCELHVSSILATVPNAMIVIDERGQILSFSAATERLFGYGEVDVVGRDVGMLLPDRPPAQTCSSSCSYTIHLLRSWSLRQTGRGSLSRTPT